MSATKLPKNSLDNHLHSQNIRLYTPSRPKSARYSLVGEERHTHLSEIEYKTLSDVLTALRQGNSITLVSSETYMTTQEAAEVLNVSRPYFVKLLEDGEIPFTKVGNRRRVLAKDLLSYKNIRDAERRQALQEFSAGIYEDGLYDLDYETVQKILNDD